MAENSVSERATRPDDVHILYSGRSVEINNTDAEGRLVVSDGVVYAKKDLKVFYLVWIYEMNMVQEKKQDLSINVLNCKTKSQMLNTMNF